MTAVHECPFCEGQPTSPDCTVCGGAGTLPDATAVVRRTAVLRQSPSPMTTQDSDTRPTHGRHCSCSACAREDWTNPGLAHCGMHGPSCPAVYAPTTQDSDTRTALDEAIEGLLGTERPTLVGGAASIVTWELAAQRLMTAYRAYRGEITMCPVPSSVTSQPCLLPEGHPQDSAARFHRYADPR